MGYQNFYATKLQNAIGASDTTITVQTPPTVTSGRLVLEARNAQNREIVSFSGVSGTELTGVVRGLYGTTAKPHLAGALTEMNFLAQDYQDLVNAYNSFAIGNNDWRDLPVVPTVNSVEGSKAYKLRFPGVDYSGILTEGMKLRLPRTTAVPTRNLLLNGTTQYASDSTVANMTNTGAFAVEAIINPTAYASAGSPTVIMSRFNATTGVGWMFRLSQSGTLQIYYATNASNFRRSSFT